MSERDSTKTQFKKAGLAKQDQAFHRHNEDGLYALLFTWLRDFLTTAPPSFPTRN
jgi:hypothetical protein